MLDLEIVQTIGSALDIVSVADMKKHLRVLHTKEDTLIEDFIKSAVADIGGFEGGLNRSVVHSRMRRYLPCFPESGVIKLPYPPTIAVESITYNDGSGDSPQPSFSSANYIVTNQQYIAEIHLLDGADWPTTIKHPRAVTVTYTAGYAAGAAPDHLKQLVKITAAHWFENREASLVSSRVTAVSHAIQFGVQHLVDKLRVPPAYDDWK